MPLYDYRCDRCGITAEAYRSVTGRNARRRCSGCRRFMRRMVGVFVGTGHFKTYVEYNLGHEPVLIHSAAELDREAEKRGRAVLGTFPGKKLQKQIDGGPKDFFPAYQRSQDGNVTDLRGIKPRKRALNKG